MRYIKSFQSEWLKKKGSAASYVTLAGGLFLPLIITIIRIVQHKNTLLSNSSDGVWQTVFNKNWQFMSVLLLPLGITLAASLIAQLEYKNNCWKQLHTTPQSLTTIFWAKFSVVFLMLVQFFIIFNLGIFLCGAIPAVVYKDIPFPRQSFPLGFFVRQNARFFLLCMPMLSLQYFLSIHIRNFIIPISIGILVTCCSLLTMSWKYGYIFPYSYCALEYMANDNRIDPSVNLYLWAGCYFLLFTVLNYLFYLYRNQGLMLGKWIKTGLVIIFLLMLAVFRIKFKKDLPIVVNGKLSSTERMILVEQNVGFVKFLVKNQLGIRERMNYYKIPGLSIAVIHNYTLDWAKSYGWANLEDSIPVTNQTLFQPGSISKSVHALGVMKLYQDGKLDLFRDINDYLKSWRFPYDARAKGKKITMAQLLSHSAGLNVHGFGFENYFRGDTIPTLVQMLNGQKPSKTEAVRSIFEPGWKYCYSGGGTLVSQLLLMNLTHEPYDSFMHREVLQPFGMNHSFFTQPPPAERIQSLASGYSQITHGRQIKGGYPISPQQAAAGLWTTATDLANMVIKLQYSLAGQPTNYLRKETAELMLTPYNDAAAALGFFIDTRNNQLYFQHGAGNPGFSGWFYGSMEKGNGVVILVNADYGSAIFEEIITAVASAYQWEGFLPQKTALNKVIVWPTKEILKKYVGAYRINQTVLVVSSKNGELWLHSREKEWRMNFTSDTGFITIESPLVFNFLKDQHGVQEISYSEERGDLKKAGKISPVSISDDLTNKYIGDYLEPGGEKASLYKAGGMLWVRSENAIAPLRLNFLNKEDFYLEENGGIFSFESNPDGTIKAIVAPDAEETRIILKKINKK